MTNNKENTLDTPTAHPPTSSILANDGSYEIVVLDRQNRVTRCIFRSPHYAAALGYLSRNLGRRPWLDMVKDGKFVDWTLTPQLLVAEPEMAGAR